MKTSEPREIQLKDYQVPNYFIETVDLKFQIYDNHTLVTSVCQFQRNPKGDANAPLELDGENLKLVSIEKDGKLLESEQYTLTDHSLTLTDLPEKFILKIETEIDPDKNTALEGLYRSGKHLCTQNESQGFRRITYFMDRPDIMASYTTTIEADQKRYPYLLSNGNLIESKTLEGGRHQVKWQDPFKKPCYLFALVAGDLGMIKDTYTTGSGREVRLEIYVDKGDENRAHYAMESLKKSMKWDEERFGLEYDLDIYMIVSVHSFNAGAMENKGLNIFNSRLVLADMETATDSDFEQIEGVVGHEYFHNWTGNRVTCRDWFQLSLKEGLTVFRDQEFSSDLNSRAVKRIDDVNELRSHQFAEDAGPMAHPIRPTSYISIDNFYTATVYEKGAEVIRMIHTLLGEQKFQAGIKKYFELFDGMAVTTDDFVRAMEEASGVDLTQFRRWYEQAGTPQISFEEKYDEANKVYSLTLKQKNPVTPGDTGEKLPLHIPISMALLDSKGSDVQAKVLELKETEQTFEFKNISERPTLSLLRGFSAPVNVTTERSEKDLLFLMANDSDSFSRWEATQQLTLSQWHKGVKALLENRQMEISDSYVNAFGAILEDHTIDDAFKAQLLILPDVNYFIQSMKDIDPDAVMEARDAIFNKLAQTHRTVFEKIHKDLAWSNSTDMEAKSSAARSLRNIALKYLSHLTDDTGKTLAHEQFNNAKNMTTMVGALSVLTHKKGEAHDQSFAKFYERFKENPVTIDKWFTLQAISQRDDVHEICKSLEKDPVFDIKNPNKCRSLYGAFASANLRHFHDLSGKGYKFFTDGLLKMDALNPQVAGRTATVYSNWRKFEPKRRELMKAELERILATKNLSKNTYEVVSKALAPAPKS
ncbi:MAG: aminopeptidase N [Bdellovibrionaceae bacterium]|nr:aminopeptidase N [Pseudobdellovibrionaceae bacterium]|tara:strand:+ start:1361 stop:3985 length:2625 start_codon:yes stop_codon:yes gene_type:complete